MRWKGEGWGDIHQKGPGSSQGGSNTSTCRWGESNPSRLYLDYVMVRWPHMRCLKGEARPGSR